ncbi:MAG: hypothetical protein ACI4RE_06375, partial [Christensenellales bacterium]
MIEVFPLLFFLERKEGKRKSSAGKFSFAASAAFANVQHKTDGSYVNRLLFFLEEKNGQLAREAQALRRTDAG